MGRREDREELELAWTVLEPRVPGTPFRKKDIEDSSEVVEAPPAMSVSDMLPRGLIAKAWRQR